MSNYRWPANESKAREYAKAEPHGIHARAIDHLDQLRANGEDVVLYEGYEGGIFRVFPASPQTSHT